MRATFSQYSVTVARILFFRLFSPASLLALGLSSVAFADAPGDVSFVGRMHGQRQDVEFLGLGGSSDQLFFQSSRRLFERQGTIALFQKHCLQTSFIIEAGSGSVSSLVATSSGRTRSSPDWFAQACSFNSFANYLKELSSKSFSMPTTGVFTSGFGPRWSRHHSGIDIANHVGTSIHASRDGRVIFTGYLGAYGLMVEIQHSDGYKTRYAHCDEILVRVGEVVTRGDFIARMGNTGRSTGPHLHFEVRSPQNVAVDPISFLGELSLQQQV